MSSPASDLFQGDEGGERKHLCEVVAKAKQNFVKQAQAFYDDGRHNEEQCLSLTKSIIETVDNVLEAGDWQSSLFLRTTIKPLMQLREEAIEVRDQLLRGQGKMAIPEHELNDNQVKAYVSLYQADGHDMHAWEGQLASITSYMTGRPIYKNEEDVRKAIRQKLLQTSEAYAVVVIAKGKLLSSDFAPTRTDRNGCELLTVEAGSIKESDVVEFVHMGKRYHYFNKRLVVKEKKKVNMWQVREEG